MPYREGNVTGNRMSAYELYIRGNYFYTNLVRDKYRWNST
jgi:hypothetical protein